MAEIGWQDLKPLEPTAEEQAAMDATRLPRFIDRKNFVVVKNEETGERVFVVQQELPAFLRRKNVKRYAVDSADRKVMRHEWRDANRRAKTLHKRTVVEAGETIELPGAQGERLFFKVLKRGWFHARYFDVNGDRRLVIDNGHGAAEIELDLELYEGFREV